MFWADKLLENRTGKEWINDSWTPSGIIHMGGLKGPIIHHVLYSIVKKQGRDVAYTFGFDDMDVIDGLPQNLQETMGQYMGIPIFKAPSPDGKGIFGEYYSAMMRNLFAQLGINAKIYQTSNLYKEGKFDNAITFVLDNVEKVRKVYEEMYHKEIASDWYPFQVICPQCGKLGTTKVTAWDGKEVSFVCSPDLVKWAKGCGFAGKMSPYGGNGKMPFKVEWAAKWWTFNVTIEGAGKDHASAGGTYDIARKIVKDVFGKEPPLWLPYEFFLYDGKKMSSSKGLGLTGEDLLAVLPAEIVRFLMIKTDPKTAVEFNPFGTQIIPKLFDDYQKAAGEYQNNTETDSARSFALSAVGEIKQPPTVRFLTLAQWVQMPNMESAIKEQGLKEWAKYARIWVEKYAPDAEKFNVQKEVPEVAKQISENQKNFLSIVAGQLDKQWIAEDFQKNLFEWAKESGITSKEAFAAIYLSLIGKDHGPKAGWLVLSLDKDFVKKRFEEVASLRAIGRNEVKEIACLTRGKRSNLEGIATSPSAPRNDSIKEIFSIDPKIKEIFPSVSVGIAIIKNVSIEKTNEQLEKEKEEILKSLEGLTTEQLGQYPEIISYRKLYKEMKVDWHSKRPSPEALLRRVALKKGLYIVNTCVDAYNLVVMKHRVSIGAFDLDNLAMPSVLRFAKEEEQILLLGDTEPTPYKPTEIGYFDQKGGYNIDFNYRDAQRTAVQETTKNLYINVDGVYDITSEKVEQVLRQACDSIIKYCGGTIELFGIETAS